MNLHRSGWWSGQFSATVMLMISLLTFILDSNNSAGRYSAQQRDMLLSLPGISSKNVNFLLDGFKNMNEVRDPRII